MAQYRIVPGNPETADLGATGRMIYDLIKEHKPTLYYQCKEDKTLIPMIQGWEKQFKIEMLILIDSGMNQSQAREIAWPEITAQFGM